MYKKYPWTYLKVVFRDYGSIFQELLKQSRSVSIHQGNLQIHAIKIVMIFMDEFKFHNLTYNLRNVETLNRSNLNSVKYGTDTIISLGTKFGKFFVITKNETFKKTLNPKLKNKKQMNAHADYAKRIPRELVLFDWALSRQVNVF